MSLNQPATAPTFWGLPRGRSPACFPQNSRQGNTRVVHLELEKHPLSSRGAAVIATSTVWLLPLSCEPLLFFLTDQTQNTSEEQHRSEEDSSSWKGKKNIDLISVVTLLCSYWNFMVSSFWSFLHIFVISWLIYSFLYLIFLLGSFDHGLWHFE